MIGPKFGINFDFGVDNVFNTRIETASGPPFNPISLNPLMFLDASNPLGNGSIPTDGTAITTWYDISGNGNNMTSSGSAPIYKQNIVNGLNVVRFNGTSNFLNNALGCNNNDSISVFSIVKVVTPVTAMDQSILSQGYFPFGGWKFSCGTTGVLKFTQNDILDNASTFSFQANTFCTVATIFNSSSGVTFYQNNEASQFQATTGLDATTAGTFLGELGNGTQFFGGDIQMILLVNGTLTMMQVGQMISWMNNRLGI